MNIQLLCETKTPQKPTALFAEAGLTHDPNSPLALVWTEAEGTERLELRKLDEPKLGAVFVDFVGGTMAHRRKFGGGRGEAVCKSGWH